jgi:hypothetical protein
MNICLLLALCCNKTVAGGRDNQPHQAKCGANLRELALPCYGNRSETHPLAQNAYYYTVTSSELILIFECDTRLMMPVSVTQMKEALFSNRKKSSCSSSASFPEAHLLDFVQ